MKLIKIFYFLPLYIFFIFFYNNTTLANNIKNSAVVFMYHKFGESKYPTTNVTIEQFKSHINEFIQPKYNIKSLNFIIDTIINDGQLPNNTIAISIDDANKSFFKVAWPIFKENKIPVTLFINTSSINNNINNLDWDDIRLLKKEGVTIGAHSHLHSHLTTLSIEQVRSEIEQSNKIFLKELNEIPTLFAYPFGETNNEIMRLLEDYKFKVAFGQHSGVINETSNLYYLPRFSLNERYGNIDRIKFVAQTKGIGIYDFIPINPQVIDNPPYIGFSLLSLQLARNIDCFVFDSSGQVDSEIFKFNERIEIRLNRKLRKGRARLNCTVKDQLGNWRWFGHQFIL